MIEQHKTNKKYFNSIWNSATASTSNEAFRLFNLDESNVVQQIIFSNSLQIYKTKDLLDDLKQELLMILLKYLERDGEEVFVNFYNKRNSFRFWLTSVAKYNFKSNSSPVYRKYIGNKNLNFDYDAIPPAALNDDEDALLLDRYEAKELKLYIGQFLYSPKAKELFHDLEIELFVHHFFGKKNKRNFSLTKLADEIELSHTTVNSIFKEVKEFLFHQLQQNKY